VSPSACAAFAVPDSNITAAGSAGGVSRQGTVFSVRNNPFHHISGDLMESCWPQALGVERAPIASDATAVRTDREGASKKDMIQRYSHKVLVRTWLRTSCVNSVQKRKLSEKHNSLMLVERF